MEWTDATQQLPDPNEEFNSLPKRRSWNPCIVCTEWGHIHQAWFTIDPRSRNPDKQVPHWERPMGRLMQERVTFWMEMPKTPESNGPYFNLAQKATRSSATERGAFDGKWITHARRGSALFMDGDNYFNIRVTKIGDGLFSMTGGHAAESEIDADNLEDAKRKAVVLQREWHTKRVSILDSADILPEGRVPATLESLAAAFDKVKSLVEDPLGQADSMLRKTI